MEAIITKIVGAVNDVLWNKQLLLLFLLLLTGIYYSIRTRFVQIRKFGEGIRENVENNVVDLLFRFQNRALKDTVSRVGADPVRKLRRNDRIVGAALFAKEQGIDPAPVIKGIVAGLKFDREGDPTAPEIQRALKEQGIDYVIETYMGLKKEEPLFGMIKAAYEA